MLETAATLPYFPRQFRCPLQIMGLLKSFLKMRKRNNLQSVHVLVRMTDAQRADLGFENLPLHPVSRFQGFEPETMMIKQSSDALHCRLLRGIDQ